ncbi:MAG: hypothetical protein A2648_00955 [Candidatus Lloydbacteria bacterium RIFCSPHIGHO2_01_FULL_41_20]|uniref:Glycosyl transferase family 11 n=1 Tax=Candidatus Lloydbacteria bacterium RIFCSPHIGHO2_01_FULL_41_20 TaxID=1798657 RepID=A0A1G2CTV5_9BACT|nr:MAG: hypothetical protein A2648_00955 [Candidatus Lloydbacteria bacterium RIFCSPHIGHO2_01_FULL_41_20]
MKKIVIIKSGGNELANQLWNYISVYAYALERGYRLVNPAFFEYGSYFNMVSAPGLLFKLFFLGPFKNYNKRKTALRRRIWRKFYTWYTKIVIFFADKNLTSSNDRESIVYYLPPSVPSTKELALLENNSKTMYFDGWLFRNPRGIEKYREKIKEYFKPRKDIEAQAKSNIEKLKNHYEKVVGVHIRQRDYEKWRNGQYFIKQGRVREIINEYLQGAGLDSSKICFAITSDGPIETSMFNGLNIFVSKENMVHDIFFLARTDLIIGSNSTFGAFASYYGNIPFIVMQKEKVDWDYYRDKAKFFENKYSTFVNY